MPNEPLTLAMTPPPDAAGEGDYQAFCAALSESARGRAFLAEYARRNRNADTELLLAALDRLERRIDAIAEAKLEEAKPAQVAPAAGEAPAAHAMPGEPPAEAARTHLAVVPPPDEPELPIPSPASGQAPAISLVPSAAMMPEVTFVGSVPPAPAVETTIATPPAPAIVETVAAEPPAQLASPPSDPLAAIMALSEDERLALFT